MSVSKNPNSYRHVKPILDAALAHGGGRYKLKTNKEALRWRLQAYQWRKLISTGGPTDYDNLILRVDDDVVVLGFTAVAGEFTKPDGSAAPVSVMVDAPQDALLDFALDFAKGLEVEDD